MRPWILFVALAVSSACGFLLIRQHYQAKTAEARTQEAMRPFYELRAKHERELAEFKAQQQAWVKREAGKDQAIVDSVKARLKIAKILYDRDAAVVGEEEATRRQQAGVYLKAALETK